MIGFILLTKRISFDRLLLSPLPCDLEESAISDLICCLDVDRAGDVRMCKHSQYGLDDVLHLFVGQPFLFAEHLLADEALLDIGVIDGRSELEQRKLERKLLWEIDIKYKLGTFIWAADGSVNEQLPMIQILL